MRWTVLSSDAVIFFPAVLYFISVYYAGKSIRQKNDLAWHIAMILLNPCFLLIDHGHFQVSTSFLHFCTLLKTVHFLVKMLNFAGISCQYNCISLGLTVAAVAAILSDRNVLGSVLFSLALNHKQVICSSLRFYSLNYLPLGDRPYHNLSKKILSFPSFQITHGMN